MTGRPVTGRPATGRPATVEPQPSRGRSQWERLLASRRMILIVLFGATGVLGLPLLWLSPAFSMSEKIAWSILNSIYTSLLIAAAGAVCYWCYLQFQNAGLL